MDEPCPSEDDLLDYVERRLDPAVEGALERHLDACSACMAVLAGLAQPRTSVGGTRLAPGDVAPGTTIDRYVVRARLGAGAMGVVVEAFDPELERRVAIKLVRTATGMASPRERARMLREAQAMARLSHPNVVPVLAVGARGDDVFVVMELVEGQTLRAWLAAAPRPWRAVVRAYVAAGRALAAAHDAGVVHRDFKPDNVLLGKDERVRVIDFGLARLVAGTRVDDEASIESGAGEVERTGVGIIVGTPAYMPPEQLLDAAVDARADQFALAVSLWEGLFGRRPFAGDTIASLVEAVQSGQLRQSPGRSQIPVGLRRALERALSARPEQRYASTGELVDALERSLRAGTRRTLMAAAAVSAVAVVAFVWVRSDDRCRAEREPNWYDEQRLQLRAAFVETEDAVASSAATVERVIDRRVATWHEAWSRACAIRDAAPGRSGAALRCLDVRRLELDAAIDLVVEGKPDVLGRAVEVVSRLPAIEPCATASDPRLALADPDALMEEGRELRSDLARARSLGDAGRLAEATAIAERVLVRAEANGHSPLRVEATSRLGALRTLAGVPGDAEPLLESAYFQAREIGHDEVAADAALELVEAVGVRMARTEDGEMWLEHAAAALERWGSVVAEAELVRKRGQLAQRRGDYEAALEHFQRALALWQQVADQDDPRLARGFDDLGTAYVYARQWDAADEHLERGLFLRERVYGEAHPVTSHSLNNLALVLMETGRLDAALDHFEWVLAINLPVYGPEHPYVGAVYNNIGAVWGRLGEPAIAAEAFAAALPAYESLGPDHPDVAMALGNLGMASLDSGDISTAFDALERALAIQEHSTGPDAASTRAYAAGLGLVSARAGAHARAVMLLRRALGGAEPPLGYAGDALALVHATLGRSLLVHGDRSGAAQALAAARAVPSSVPPDVSTDMQREIDALARELDQGASSSGPASR